MKKRGQAAMEFLMTYGWAILIVLAAVAALAYFGMFSQERFLPEKCLLSAGLYCKSYKADATEGITLLVESSLPTGIIVTKIEFKEGSTTLCSGTFTTELKSSDSATFVSSCSPTLTSGARFRSDIVITYDEVGGLTNLIRTGSIVAKVI